MPIGTELPNVYPCDFRLKRTIVDQDYDEVAVNPDGSINVGLIGDHLGAFGRQRTAEPYTIFDSKQIGDKQPLFYDDQAVSGGGTSSTWDTNRSSTLLAVSATTAGKHVRQTKQRFNYQPGKSQLGLFTFVAGETPAGITKEIGLFDDANGIFYRNTGGVPSLVVRSSVSGSPVDDDVVQSNWNVDKLDGTGPSGITYDFAKATIFFFDFEWLGVGTIRFGFFVNGAPIYVHKEHNAGFATSVYMTTPNLPVRYSIENDGTGVVSTLEHICSSIISEGGVQATGVVRAVDRAVTPLTTANNTLVYPLVSIRLKATYRDITVVPSSVEVFTTANVSFRWVLLLNPTIAGTDAVSWVSLANSAIEYDITRNNTNTLTGGTLITSGYGSSSNQSKRPINRDLANALKIGETIAGVGDQLVLGVQNVAAGTNPYYGSLEFREYL